MGTKKASVLLMIAMLLCSFNVFAMDCLYTGGKATVVSSGNVSICVADAICTDGGDYVLGCLATSDGECPDSNTCLADPKVSVKAVKVSNNTSNNNNSNNGGGGLNAR
jgi:hypothetical protein